MRRSTKTISMPARPRRLTQADAVKKACQPPAIVATVQEGAAWALRPRHLNVPKDSWLRCPACSAMIHRSSIEDRKRRCPECRRPFSAAFGKSLRLAARERVNMLVDPGSFEEMHVHFESRDVLGFVDRKSYAARLVEGCKATGTGDAVRSGRAYIKGRPIILAVMEFGFMAGSMGAVMGEKIVRATERATRENVPLVVICSSGGVRMQESAIALMQMAKTAAALARFAANGGLFISVLTDPTFGGVTASFAMLGDLIFAEPGAVIGFAGPGVIAGTIRSELPAGFQTAEFLLERGFIDRIVGRNELRHEIARAIDFCGK